MNPSHQLTPEQIQRLEQIRRDEMRTTFIAAAIQGLCAEGEGHPSGLIARKAVFIADEALAHMAEKQQLSKAEA